LLDDVSTTPKPATFKSVMLLRFLWHPIDPEFPKTRFINVSLTNSPVKPKSIERPLRLISPDSIVRLPYIFIPELNFNSKSSDVLLRVKSWKFTTAPDNKLD